MQWSPGEDHHQPRHSYQTKHHSLIYSGSTCSQRHAALLLLVCDWTDAIGDVVQLAGERREGGEAAHAAHLHRAQRQVAHQAGAVLDEAVGTGPREWVCVGPPAARRDHSLLTHLDMSLKVASRAVVYVDTRMASK